DRRAASDPGGNGQGAVVSRHQQNQGNREGATMQLVRHLNHAELTELLLDEDQQELQHTLGALPSWLRTAADQPEWFWLRQQAAIGSRRAPAKHARVRPAVAGASAFALTLLALLLFNSGPAPQPTLA